MHVAIVSDTHVPSRAREIPDWVREELDRADHVVHAGDFDSPEAHATVADLADALTAVGGNLDPVDLDVPEVATVRLGGRTFVVTHGTGPSHNYEQRIADAVADHAEDPDAVGVAGHTHEVLDTTVGGTRVLNPGSATGAAPAVESTLMVAEVVDGDLSVEVRRD